MKKLRMDEIFSSLQTLHLQNLPLLESICPRALRFPALIEIHVDQCKSLEELPLNAGSASRLKQIKGTKSWWNQLRWMDSAIKEAFRSKFIEIPNYDNDNDNDNDNVSDNYDDEDEEIVGR
jgi:hypothetical protein